MYEPPASGEGEGFASGILTLSRPSPRRGEENLLHSDDHCGYDAGHGRFTTRALDRPFRRFVFPANHGLRLVHDFRRSFFHIQIASRRFGISEHLVQFKQSLLFRIGIFSINEFVVKIVARAGSPASGALP
jgi:hypothetical protein